METLALAEKGEVLTVRKGFPPPHLLQPRQRQMTEKDFRLARRLAVIALTATLASDASHATPPIDPTTQPATLIPPSVSQAGAFPSRLAQPIVAGNDSVRRLPQESRSASDKLTKESPGSVNQNQVNQNQVNQNQDLAAPAIQRPDANQQALNLTRQPAEQKGTDKKNAANQGKAVKNQTGRARMSGVSPSKVKVGWWEKRLDQPLLQHATPTTLQLSELLIETLNSSPAIEGAKLQSSATYQQIIQQDAAFDPKLILGADIGRTNEPVGDLLTTGGPGRLNEESLNLTGGIEKVNRSGAKWDVRQQLGLLDSNSNFFDPRNQGNARLSVSMTKPLMSRGSRYYNERLLTDAFIENRAVWQQMRGDIEQRLSDAITAYWELYQLRTQFVQQRELLRRGREIENVIKNRQKFDAGRVELVKAQQRVAKRNDQVIEMEATLRTQQARLAALVGSARFETNQARVEFIPDTAPQPSGTQLSLRDAMSQAFQYRGEIGAATEQVARAALQMRVSRVELEPQLNWIFNGYLAQLNGDREVLRSFGDQFTHEPGFSTGLEFELPIGNRAARARSREAFLQLERRNERLREVIKVTEYEVQAAKIDLERLEKQQSSKRAVLTSAIEEEEVLTLQWEVLGGDETGSGVRLENLLDAQQRRTNAEMDLIAVQTQFMVAQVKLQRAMGTLLINEGISSTQSACSGDVEFHPDRGPLEMLTPFQSLPDEQPAATPGKDKAASRALQAAAARMGFGQAVSGEHQPSDAHRQVAPVPSSPTPWRGGQSGDLAQQPAKSESFGNGAAALHIPSYALPGPDTDIAESGGDALNR